MSPSFHRSPTFAVGSHDWSMHYHPQSQHAADSIDLCLHLETKGGRATISSSLGLLDPTATLPPVNLVPESPAMALDYDDATGSRSVTHWVPKSLLVDVQASRYVKRGSLTFEWTITILSAETPAPAPARHKVPAATDVTFSVGGELFDAHVFVLAMRSPVFKAELFGGTMEMASDDEARPPPIIVVEDMRPDVFQALLCYIYTDDLPPRPDPEAAAGHQADEEEDENDMLYHLLVAADRYDMRGLKLLCQAILCRKLDVHNVAKLLAFADDHYCSTLKDACVEFMADSDTMKEVVASQGYQQLRLKHPLVLLEVLEKCVMFSRDNLSD